MIVLFTVASILGVTLSAFNRNRRWMSFTDELKAHQWIFTGVVAAFIATELIPAPEFAWMSVVKEQIQEAHGRVRESGSLLQAQIQDRIPGDSNSQWNWYDWLRSFWVLGIAIHLSILLRDYLRLKGLQKRSHLTHRLGRVRVYWHDRLQVPLSYQDWNHAGIVLPLTNMDRSRLGIFLAHESQHLRSRDPQWLWILRLAKAIHFWNPFFRKWSEKWIQLQELACDEALLGRERVSSQAYASCLLDVARDLNRSGKTPACATGLSLWANERLLKRRIRSMFQNIKPQSRMVTWAMASTVFTLLSFSAWAQRQWTQDRTITQSEAQAWFRKASNESQFPLTMNDQVLQELNRYAGTIEGRKFIRESLERMAGYRSQVDSKLKQHGIPAELAAIPIVESGYQNLTENGAQGRGVGLWMFIPSTAKRYGLEPDGRLDPEASTDAAARYLKNNYGIFNDWHLSVLAYNAGESAVQRGIKQSGRNNAWDLVKAGVSNDEGYLARVIAAIILSKNPEALE